MTSKRLAANVWLDGVLHEAGSSPAKDVVDQITNPKAWGEEAEDEKPSVPATRRKS